MLYRKADGNVAALQDRCPHRFAPLHMGKSRSRRPRAMPVSRLGIRRVPGACTLNPHGDEKHSVTGARSQLSRDREAQSDMDLHGRDRPADFSKVPDFSVLDNVPEMHATKRDRITIKANYELIIDNLLDLSHTSYLHDGILGNADTVESEISVAHDGDDVIVGRHAGNAKAPGIVRHPHAGGAGEGR